MEADHHALMETVLREELGVQMETNPHVKMEHLPLSQVLVLMEASPPVVVLTQCAQMDLLWTLLASLPALGEDLSAVMEQLS